MPPPFDPQPAQIDVRGTTVGLVPEKQIEHDVPVIDPPDGAVGIQFETQAGRTGGAEGKCGGFRSR